MLLKSMSFLSKNMPNTASFQNIKKGIKMFILDFDKQPPSEEKKKFEIYIYNLKAALEANLPPLTIVELMIDSINQTLDSQLEHPNKIFNKTLIQFLMATQAVSEYIKDPKKVKMHDQNIANFDNLQHIFGKLPAEIHLSILSFLDPDSKKSARITCSFWNELLRRPSQKSSLNSVTEKSDENKLWEEIFKLNKIKINPHFDSKLIYQLHRKDKMLLHISLNPQIQHQLWSDPLLKNISTGESRLEGAVHNFIGQYIFFEAHSDLHQLLESDQNQLILTFALPSELVRKVMPEPTLSFNNSISQKNLFFEMLAKAAEQDKFKDINEYLKANTVQLMVKYLGNLYTNYSHNPFEIKEPEEKPSLINKLKSLF